MIDGLGDDLSPGVFDLASELRDLQRRFVKYYGSPDRAEIEVLPIGEETT
jgi:hypothetical protein